jgi:GAF domain-containing protein
MSPSTPAPSLSSNFSQDDWRDQFLQRILTIAAVLGVFAVTAGVLTTDTPILQGIYIGVFITLVAIIVLRPPYLVRAGVFTALPFILGVSSMTNAGLRGDSMFFFLASVTFSALLIGPRSGMVAIGLSEAIIITMGYLTLNGSYTPLDPSSGTSTLANWITDSVLHLLISSVVLAGLRMLQNGFNRAQAQNQIMFDSLRESQMELENRVAERTKELARKTEQLNASAFVSRQTAEIQELDKLLSSTVNLIAKQFELYHAAIYIINERGDHVILQAASSEGGKKMLENGHRLGVGTQGIIGLVAAEKKPRIVNNVHDDTAFLKTPELSETRSVLALPLIVRNKVIGVLDLQSSKAQAYQYDDIEMFQALANQIAVGIENTRLLTESQLVISQYETISSENTLQDWKTELATSKTLFHYSGTGVRPIDKLGSQKGKNVLAIPITLRGQKIGKISLERKAEFQKWTTQEEIVATEVAAQTALALENIRLVERTKQRAKREQAISNITTHVRETLDLDTVLRTSAREIQRALNLQEAEVRLIHQDRPDDEKKPNQIDSSQSSGNQTHE